MQKTSEFDVVIIGAGFFGLYTALLAAKRNLKVLVLDQDREPFLRASQVNQARLHLGYHYPRSMGTALSSIDFFHQFNEEFKNCVNSSFEKIYAIADQNSLTPKDHFEKFCAFAKIPLESIPLDKYFNPDTVSGAYLTQEYSFDFSLLKKQVLEEIAQTRNVDFLFNTSVGSQKIQDSNYDLFLTNGDRVMSPAVVNATYAGLNQILSVFDLPNLKLRYELTEVALCKPNNRLSNLGITVMDGSFFSTMPFGKSGYHSLTAVDYTPHKFSNTQLPSFSCQSPEVNCSPLSLGNCNRCPNKPETSFPWMNQIMRNFLKPELSLEYADSLFTVKTVLQQSEIDDSRPTYVSTLGNKPRFISVFSGKINTVFELAESIHNITELL